jgi:hypothetical protein
MTALTYTKSGVGLVTIDLPMAQIIPSYKTNGVQHSSIGGRVQTVSLGTSDQIALQSVWVNAEKHAQLFDWFVSVRAGVPFQFDETGTAAAPGDQKTVTLAINSLKSTRRKGGLYQFHFLLNL